MNELITNAYNSFMVISFRYGQSYEQAHKNAMNKLKELFDYSEQEIDGVIVDEVNEATGKDSKAEEEADKGGHPNELS